MASQSVQHSTVHGTYALCSLAKLFQNTISQSVHNFSRTAGVIMVLKDKAFSITNKHISHY